MDRVTKYDEIVKEMVRAYADYLKPNDGTKIEAVIDERHEHFQIFRTGWSSGTFRHDCLLHLAIRSDGKIHVLRNQTEFEVDIELLRQGVPEEDIVVEFSPHRAPSGV